MLSKQDKNIVSVYLVTIIVTAVLVFVIINFNNWFLMIHSQLNPSIRRLLVIPLALMIFNQMFLQETVFARLAHW